MIEKALSVRQPWAWLIVNGHKPVENRPGRFHYRGPLVIHAGATMTRADYFSCSLFVRGFAPELAVQIPDPEELERGGLVGRVNLVDCVESMDSDWFCGPFGLVVNDVKPIPFIPYKGQLGLFNVEIIN